jgi:ubiquitin carboxyl-terminal hydrolase 5/13
MKKLAITAPTDDELYSYSTSVRCFGCSSVGEAVHSDDPKVGMITITITITSP